jgi:hypothetical protein
MQIIHRRKLTGRYAARIEEIKEELKTKSLGEAERDRNISRFDYAGIGFGYKIKSKYPKILLLFWRLLQDNCLAINFPLTFYAICRYKLRRERTMGKFYKREVSLMDQRIFPRESLDKPIANPDADNSIPVSSVNHSDREIVDYVVSDLKRTPKE